MKAKEMEPVRGTCAARKRVEEFFKGLLSEEEALAVAMGAYEEDSKKKNQDVGEGSSFSILCHIVNTLSPPPIPVIMVYFSTHFYTILSNFKLSFFHLTHSRLMNNKDKTQEILVLVQRCDHKTTLYTRQTPQLTVYSLNGPSTQLPQDPQRLY